MRVDDNSRGCQKLKILNQSVELAYWRQLFPIRSREKQADFTVRAWQIPAKF